MAVRIEDAGFEIRDMIAWVYGSGFPKSHNLEGEWQGWGTALKPALEPITVARKPFPGTVAANVLEHGTGALNVDGCRVGTGGATYTQPNPTNGNGPATFTGKGHKPFHYGNNGGRWPANLIHDGTEEALAVFPECKTGAIKPYFSKGDKGYSGGWGEFRDFEQEASAGSAARFFYCAKASKADRDEGCEGLEERDAMDFIGSGVDGRGNDYETKPRRNHHPTVKPTALMRYLCRLVTPRGGTVLDPFMGSGSTGKAAVLEGFNFIGIEREAEYVQIAKARIAAAEAERAQALPLGA
jgi:site-specific DNA-methyltransferase (adenine-specific)